MQDAFTQLYMELSDPSFRSMVALDALTNAGRQMRAAIRDMYMAPVWNRAACRAVARSWIADYRTWKGRI